MAIANPQWFPSACAGQHAPGTDAEAVEAAYASLRGMPNLMAEVRLTNVQQREATLALSLSDVLPAGGRRFADIWREARDGYVEELVRNLRSDLRMTELEALERLQVVYA